MKISIFMKFVLLLFTYTEIFIHLPYFVQRAFGKTISYFKNNQQKHQLLLKCHQGHYYIQFQNLDYF